jgi:Recombination endonuclease VII
MAEKIITRAEAIARGLQRYFHGKRCRKGHLAERLTKNQACVECSRLWREANPDYQEQYLSNPHKRERHNKRHRDWTAARTDKLATRPRPLACEVCETPGKVTFDHCHFTGRFRGWICHNCNITLGRMNENPSALRKLADYIERGLSDHKQADWIAKADAKRVLQP